MMSYTVLYLLGASVSPVLAQDCPPSRGAKSSASFQVNGHSDGRSWAWCVIGTGFKICNLNVPIAAGLPANEITEVLVASINSSGCPGLTAVQSPQSPYFTVKTSCPKWPRVCFGPGGAEPTHWLQWSHPDSVKLDFSVSQSFFIEFFSPCGDVDDDWRITHADAVALLNYLFGKSSSSYVSVGANANGDCAINLADAVTIVNYVLGDDSAMGECW